jgi:hypothetical protein
VSAHVEGTARLHQILKIALREEGADDFFERFSKTVETPF